MESQKLSQLTVHLAMALSISLLIASCATSSNIARPDVGLSSIDGDAELIILSLSHQPGSGVQIDVPFIDFLKSLRIWGVAVTSGNAATANYKWVNAKRKINLPKTAPEA